MKVLIILAGAALGVYLGVYLALAVVLSSPLKFADNSLSFQTDIGYSDGAAMFPAVQLQPAIGVQQ